MKKILLEIKGMSYSQSQSGAYALILEEVGSNRRLPIIIGAFEAHAIAIEIEKIKPSRPLTHDLLKSVALAFGVQLREVVISKFQAGVFHATLICFDEQREVEIDSRTSDAIALALRFKCRIYTYEHIMAEASILIEDENAETQEEHAGEQARSSTEYSLLSMLKLEELLQQAIDEEDYEKASQIRDEIRKKKKSSF
ncbi:MAG: bifunctional nuclease family protein [Bacteroidales bacterium]|nr:bifunctional nuclease family protein [Bacteroidales bacterium]